MSINENYEIILQSKEFDENFYKKKYGLNDNTNAIYHYLTYGAKNNYNPSNDFDTQYYLEENFDVKKANINPLVHYIQWGKSEGRLPKLMNLHEIIEKGCLDKKMNLVGKDKYLFSVFDSTSELKQHFTPTFKEEFNYEKFSNNLSFKKKIFKKYGINYNCFIIPDKSIVCKNKLPFKYSNIYRIIDKLDLIDYSKYIKDTQFSKTDNHINNEGGRLLFIEMIKSINNEFNETELKKIINKNELKYTEKNDSFTKIPINLKKGEIPQSLKEFKENLTYYYNENSYSNQSVLIFYNDNIDPIKFLFPFYFREVVLCYDHGIINKDIISWFNPNLILEIRNEKYIPFYEDCAWVENRLDFLKENTLNTSRLKLEKTPSLSKKISVIIPVYNVENYLNECLDSVINQTFKDIEIICINDGSTDNSLNILKQYMKNDNRIRIINTPNQRQGAARNLGLTQANGEYIFFLDSDDWIEKNALELLYNKAKKLNLEMLFYQVANYNENNKTIEFDPIYDHECFQDKTLNLKNIFNYKDVSKHLFKISVIPYSKLYKKSFLASNNLKFPEGMIYEDNAFFYDVFFKCEKAGFLKKHLLYRRRHEDSVTSKFNEKQLCIITGMNIMINKFIETGKYEQFKHELINHTFSNVMQRFMNSPLYFKQKFFQAIKTKFIGFNELKSDFNSYLEKNRILFDLFNKHEYYIKFDSEYKLRINDYKIFNGKRYFSPKSNEYKDFKNNEKNKNYEIGIIIPIYNNGTLTHRTMMSLENQTFNFDNLEIILINDHSSDETREIINEYARNNENVKAIHTNKSSGSSGTPRNIGIQECTSKYMLFLDHDDFLEINALEILYKEIISTSSDVVFGTYSIIQNNSVEKVILKEKYGYFNNITENERLIAYPAPSLWTKLYNTNFIKKHEFLFPTILGEDAIFVTESLINANGITYLHDTNICFHDLRDTSTTNNISLKYMQELFVSEMFLYNYYQDINKEYYCTFKANSIMDFALNQLVNSNLTPDELNNLFDLMRTFILFHDKFESKPDSPRNKILFEIILAGDKDLLSYYINLEKNKEKNIKKHEKLISEIDKLKRKINSINNSNSNLSHEKKLLITSNSDLKNENNRLKEKNDELSKFKEDVLNSNSWKATKTFRKIGPKLK